MNTTGRQVRDFEDKIELMKKIVNLRYPNGLDGNKITMFKVFEMMKNENILPKTWTTKSGLSKFYERNIKLRGMTEDDKNNENKIEIKRKNNSEIIMSVIKSICDRIELTYKDKFEIFIKRINDEERYNFMEMLVSIAVFNGIKNKDALNFIENVLSKNGLYTKNMITKIYMKKNKIVNVMEIKNDSN